jgi:hypothetical protein
VELLFIAGVAAALWLFLKSPSRGSAGAPADDSTSVASYSPTVDYGFPGSLSEDLDTSNPGDPNNTGWPAWLEKPLAPARPGKPQ